jgi:hypothetical protein
MTALLCIFPCQVDFDLSRECPMSGHPITFCHTSKTLVLLRNFPMRRRSYPDFSIAGRFLPIIFFPYQSSAGFSPNFAC